MVAAAAGRNQGLCETFWATELSALLAASLAAGEASLDDCDDSWPWAPAPGWAETAPLAVPDVPEELFFAVELPEPAEPLAAPPPVEPPPLDEPPPAAGVLWLFMTAARAGWFTSAWGDKQEVTLHCVPQVYE
jgi:hypothetical protein